MEIPSLKQLIDIKNNTIIEKVAEIKKVLYFIHPMGLFPKLVENAYTLLYTLTS